MPLDLRIIIIFLIGTLFLGMHHSKGVKTFEDYAMGQRKMSTFALTLSLIATTYGGNILTTRLDAFYKEGVAALIMDLASPLSFYLAARCFIVRMKEFLGDFSIATSMGKIYGNTIRCLTGLLGALLSIALIVPQFKVTAKIASFLPGIHGFVSPIVLSILVVLYATFGGARAVVSTDVYQFFTFGLCFPMLIFMILYHSHAPDIYHSLSTIPQLNFKQVLSQKETILTLASGFVWHSIFPFDPARIQRFYMASSIQEAQKIFSRSAICRIIISLLFLFTAVALYTAKHTIPKNYNVFDYIVQLDYFPGMKAICISAVIALLMSTADSNLHAASVLVTYDVLPIFYSRSKAYKASLGIAKIVSICIGLISLFLTIHTTNFSQLLNKAVLFYVPCVTVPFLMTSLGFRPRSSIVLWNMGIHIGLTLYRIVYKAQSISQKYIFLSIVFSSSTLLILHYVLPKLPNRGWVGIQDSTYLDHQLQATQLWWSKVWNKCTMMLTPSYWMQQFPKKKETFIKLGLYIIVYTFVALWYINRTYIMSYVYWYVATISFGICLVCYPDFYNFKKWIPLLWPIILYHVLIVSGKTFMLLGECKPIVCFLFLLNVIVVLTLLEWQIVLIMVVLITTIPHGYYILPNIDVATSLYSSWSKASNTLWVPITTLFCLMFILYYKYTNYKREQELAIIKLLQQSEHNMLLESMQHQKFYRHLVPKEGCKALAKIKQALTTTLQEMHPSSKNIELVIEKLNGFETFLLTKAYQEKYLEINKHSLVETNIYHLVDHLRHSIDMLDLSIKLLVRFDTAIHSFWVNEKQVSHLLATNILVLSRQVEPHSILVLTISDTRLAYGYPIQSSKQPRVLPALAFLLTYESPQESIEATYSVHLNGTIYNDIELTNIEMVCKFDSMRIVDTHGGYSNIDETNLTRLYVFPIDARKIIRTKSCTSEPLEIATTKESLSMEKRLKSLFLQKTSLNSMIIDDTIQLIKEAHGNTRRKSGEPYYMHPMAAAELLLNETNNAEAILAALLHDVVEDTQIPLSYLTALYGTTIATIVDGVTHLHNSIRRWKLTKEENQAKLIEMVSKDLRVLEVKLADRLHNVMTLGCRSIADQKRITQETMAFFIPLAETLGVGKKYLVPELKKLCSNILN